MGCTCFVISTSKYYMLNSQKQWVEITPFGKVTSTGDGNDVPVEPDEPEQDDVIYEGGLI